MVVKQRSAAYDYEWDCLAKRHLRNNPQCAVVGCNSKGRHVDHIVGVKAAPHRRLDPMNLQTLCHKHHNIITAAYEAGSLRGACSIDGMPLDPAHPWNARSNQAAIVAANARPRADPILAAGLKRAATRGRTR